MQRPSSHFAERAGSRLQACSSSKELRGLPLTRSYGAHYKILPRRTQVGAPRPGLRSALALLHCQNLYTHSAMYTQCPIPNESIRASPTQSRNSAASSDRPLPAPAFSALVFQSFRTRTLTDKVSSSSSSTSSSNINTEALCAAPLEPSQMPLSCPVAPGRPVLKS